MDHPLPPSSEIAVDRLAGCFHQVTNSYKFFWFLALLDHVRLERTSTIPISHLLAQMVAIVWYPSNYYRLYFGKQDQLRNVTERLLKATGLPVDSKTARVREAALERVEQRSAVGKELIKLGDYVPYRFLRPFVEEEARGLPDQTVNVAVIRAAARRFEEQPENVPYRFVGVHSLELSPRWVEYLRTHNEILRGFCLWHLTKYLQGHNPNVANIPGNLFPPGLRDLKVAKRYWELVFKQKGSLPCIYSGQWMTGATFSLDHFLPWRFVAHDLLWNLIPAPKEVNSAKSDSLPDISLYFDPFARMQYDGVQSIVEVKKPTLLEDYILLLHLEDIDRLRGLSFEDFRRDLQEVVLPQIQIARNMGFRANWRYAGGVQPAENPSTTPRSIPH